MRTKSNGAVWMTGMLVVALSWVAWRSASGPVLLFEKAPISNQSVVDREAVYRDHVQPILDSHVDVDRESFDRCIARIRDRFREYRTGVKPFAEDITSTWTRLGVLSRMPLNWWKQDGRVDKYIREKFEEHLFSEEKLTEDITLAFKQLKEDLTANRSQLLSKVKIAIHESELPHLEVPEQLEFEGEVLQRLQAFLSRRATESAYSGIASLIASDVATAIVAAIVTRAVTSIGTSIATSSAAAGGATAGSATAGAGGGSLVGPAGTAIGLGVGLVVGIAVDWWMTDSFRGRLEGELESYLFRLEHGILFGENGNEGIESDLKLLLDDLTKAQQEALSQKLIGTHR